MPDLERCVQYKGKTYCWNKVTQRIAVAGIKDLDFKDCPACVIQAIIESRQEADDEIA